jgi:hypothetical protein
MTTTLTTVQVSEAGDGGLLVQMPKELIDLVGSVHYEGETLQSFVDAELRKAVVWRRLRAFVGPPAAEDYMQTFQRAQVQHALQMSGAVTFASDGDLAAFALRWDVAPPSLKTAFLPQPSVKPQLRAAVESVLLVDESLPRFIEKVLRFVVEDRRDDAAFGARAQAPLERYQRTGVTYPAEEVLADMRERLEARRRELAGRHRPSDDNGGRTIEDVMAELHEHGRQATERLRAEKARREAAASSGSNEHAARVLAQGAIAGLTAALAGDFATDEEIAALGLTPFSQLTHTRPPADEDEDGHG